MSSEQTVEGEYTRRIERARALMEGEGLDALLLFTGPNLIYFTGATGMLGGRSGSRPFVYLLPRKGEPAIIVHEGRQFETRTLTNVRDVRTYARLSSLPLEQVLGAIEEHGLSRSRIGAELGMEMVLDLPFSEFMRLKEALPRAQFADAAPLLWRLRMVKSPAEVEWITRACAITSEAYTRTFAGIRAGMAESEIELMMLQNMQLLGGSAPWVLVTSGEGNYDLVSKGGGPRRVQKADMVWMDAGCSFHGYYSDFSRAGVVGTPSAQQLEGQRLVHELTAQGVEMLRVGTPVADIARRLNRGVEALPLQATSNISALAGRVGHGMGMFITEPPSLSENDPTILEEGMVVTMEPGVGTLYGTFHVEENVLVTADGPRVLSSSHWQLWETGG